MTAAINRRALSIRARLLLVGAATVTLVVSLLVSMVLNNIRMARETAVQRLLNVAEGTAGNVERLVRASQAATVRFAEDADLVLADPRRCDMWLGRGLILLPEYTNLALVDSSGRAVCSHADSVVGAVNIGDRPYFASILNGRSVVSDPLVGRRSGAWIVVFGAPVRSRETGEPVGAVILPLDLSRVQNFTTGVTLPQGAIITVATTDSLMVVARSRDPEQWVGRKLPPAVDPDSQLGRARVLESRTVEGDPTLFVALDVPDTPWRVYAGWSRAEAYGQAVTEARRSALFAISLVLIMVAGLAWVYVPTTRSLSQLVAGAEAAAGDRTPLPPKGPSEIRTVALRINETLGKLAAAETEAQKLAQATRQFADPVFIADCAGTLEFVNPAWEQVTGYAATDALGRPVTDLSFGQAESGESFAAIWSRVRSGQPFRGRVESVRKDGTRYVDEMTMTPLRDGEGAITHIVATSRDMTEADALAERLREAEKLKAVGQLAGGVAHDFNNLLTAITGYAELLELDLQTDPKQAQAHIQEILKGTQMARSLTHQLLTFSRRQVLQERNVSLNEVITRLVSFLRRVIPAHVHVRQELDPGAGAVWIDVVHAEQIVLNLALNARDAMPAGGELVLRTRGIDAGPDSPTGWIELEVQDTGAGVPDDIKPKVFDPFFTTKSRGTGLGLATVHDVVTRAGGSVTIEDGPGMGSLFRVRLPRSATDMPVVVNEAAAMSIDDGRGLVLLAEDNEAVRPFFRRVLAGAGYTVFEASDGADALRAVATMPGPPAIVVTDVMMPRMKGPALVQELRRRWPDLPALFVSGYAEPDLDVAIPDDDRSERLTKPVSPSDLTAAVARLLGRTPRHRDRAPQN